MAAIGDGVAAGRGDGRRFYGWAVIAAARARENGRKVEADPLLSNPYHANIVLPVPFGPDVDDARFQHAQDLALKARFRPRPEATSTPGSAP